MRVVALVLLTTLLATATADFAGVDGFSGRAADCTSCHTPSPVADPATVALDGLPDGWMPGATYALTVTVAGGPPAMPAPQPQGGFELEVESGTLSIPPDMEGLLRQPKPTGMTYTPEGTQRRAWSIDWTAPDLATRPGPVGVWLAAVSANGNHVIATNTSDAGEHGDQTATLQLAVPPAPEADDAWRALPLAPPVLTTTDATELAGHHADGNATHLAYRIDGGDWQRRATAANWRLRLGGTPETVELRSEGADRTSSVRTVAFQGGAPTVLDGEAPVQESPAPLLLPLLPFLLLTRRRP